MKTIPTTFLLINIRTFWHGDNMFIRCKIYKCCTDRQIKW